MTHDRESERRELEVGHVVGPRGVAGELKIDLKGSDAARFVGLRRVLLGEARAQYPVRRARVHRGQGLLLLAEIDSREAAEACRGAVLYAWQDEMDPLAPDEYLISDILGLQVITDDGEALGEVIEVIVTGANDVYVVRGPYRDLLLPAIKQVVLTIDLSAGKMTVRLLEGMR